MTVCILGMACGGAEEGMRMRVLRLPEWEGFTALDRVLVMEIPGKGRRLSQVGPTAGGS